MATSLDAFLKKNARFYLQMARTRALDFVTGTPPLLAEIEKAHARLRTSLEGTTLGSFLDARDSATLYREWIADAENQPSFSMQSTEEDLNILVNEAEATNDLVADSVTLLQELQGQADPDNATLVLIALNIQILELKWNNLTDAFVINVAHELRTSYELFVDKVATRRGTDFTPIEWSKSVVSEVNAAVFTAQVVYQALLKAIDSLYLFKVEDQALRPRPKFAGENPTQLASAYFTSDFLNGHLEKIARLQKELATAGETLSALFTIESWKEDGRLHRFPMVLTQLWDDRGLLSCVPFADLSTFCGKHGPLWEKGTTNLEQARLWIEALVNVRRLTDLQAKYEKLRFEIVAFDFESLPEEVQGGTEQRLDMYEMLIETKEQALFKSLLELHAELGRMRVDYAGIVDPTVVEMIACLSGQDTLSGEEARCLVLLARKMGPFYEPIRKHLKNIRRECRYLKKLHPYHKETLLECHQMIEKRDFEQARMVFEEFDRRFPDVDYSAIENALAEWQRFIEGHQSLPRDLRRDRTGDPGGQRTEPGPRPARRHPRRGRPMGGLPGGPAHRDGAGAGRAIIARRSAAWSTTWNPGSPKPNARSRKPGP